MSQNQYIANITVLKEDVVQACNEKIQQQNSYYETQFENLYINYIDKCFRSYLINEYDEHMINRDKCVLFKNSRYPLIAKETFNETLEKIRKIAENFITDILDDINSDEVVCDYVEDIYIEILNAGFKTHDIKIANRYFNMSPDHRPTIKLSREMDFTSLEMFSYFYDMRADINEIYNNIVQTTEFINDIVESCNKEPSEYITLTNYAVNFLKDRLPDHDSLNRVGSKEDENEDHSGSITFNKPVDKNVDIEDIVINDNDIGH